MFLPFYYMLNGKFTFYEIQYLYYAHTLSRNIDATAGLFSFYPVGQVAILDVCQLCRDVIVDRDLPPQLGEEWLEPRWKALLLHDGLDWPTCSWYMQLWLIATLKLLLWIRLWQEIVKSELKRTHIFYCTGVEKLCPIFYRCDKAEAWVCLFSVFRLTRWWLKKNVKFLF